MRLYEMYNPPIEGYQDLQQDNSKNQWGETRKTRLTLRQISKLRRMLDVRNFERVKDLKKIHDQYGQKPESSM